MTATGSSALPPGEIVATGVSPDAYLQIYAAIFHEWVRGAVINVTPASLRHMLLTKYLLHLLDVYFELNPIGRALPAPFVMRLESVNSFREPDVQIILNGNPGQLTDTAMIGPADICIEVVSPESVVRDYGDKFEEYEKAGVREYWIIDPLRQRCDFNRLDTSGVYTVMPPDEVGDYQTPLLPRLALHVPTLWLDELPGALTIGQAVQKMWRKT